MSRITYQDGVAIAQLVFYSPALLLAIYVCWRHGFAKASGWIFLVIFAGVRLAGAGARMYLIGNPTSDDAVTASLICSILGLSPLLLAWLGLLSRIFYTILDQPWRTTVCTLLVKAIQVPATVGLVLCIVGATSADTPEEVYGQSTVRIGISLFAAVFAVLLVLTVIATLLSRSKQRGETLLILAVNLVIPFMLIRLIYSLLAAFSHISIFTIGNHSTSAVTALLLMEVIEEFVIATIYLWAGIVQPALHMDAGPSKGGLARLSDIGVFKGRGAGFPIVGDLLEMGRGREQRPRRGTQR